MNLHKKVSDLLVIYEDTSVEAKLKGLYVMEQFLRKLRNVLLLLYTKTT